MINDVLTVGKLRVILAKNGIVPRKHWGQNFLVNKKILERMLSTADVTETDVVLEVGGGAGALSGALADRAKRVIVIERDPSLCKLLIGQFSDTANIEIRCEDARNINTDSLPHDYRMISNLPYSVGLPILRTLIESTNPPTDIHVMLQKEVAERLVAKAPRRTLAGSAMQTIASVSYLFTIPKSATWPVPDVESAYLALVPRNDLSVEQRNAILKQISLGFRHPRKRVLRNITKTAKEATDLGERCGVLKDARASELSDTQWRCVASV